MQLTSSVVLFALGASAAATHRRHQRLHEKRAVGDVVTATIDGKVVQWLNNWDGKTAVAVPTSAAPAETAQATPPAASPVAAAEGASSDSNQSSGGSESASNSGVAKTYTPFCSGPVNKRATLAEIHYKGNTGNGDWGCNFQLVDSSIADQYDHVLKFKSQGSDSQSCVCWNKIGPDGGVNGAFGHAAVSFKVQPGTEQVVAVDKNTQGSCGCNSGDDIPKDQYGEWAVTWAEFDVANESNNGWSGADVSALVPQAHGFPVQGMKISGGGQSSSLKAGAADVKAAYVGGMEAVDGVGLNIPPGKTSFEVIVGYTG